MMMETVLVPVWSVLCFGGILVMAVVNIRLRREMLRLRGLLKASAYVGTGREIDVACAQVRREFVVSRFNLEHVKDVKGMLGHLTRDCFMKAVVGLGDLDKFFTCREDGERSFYELECYIFTRDEIRGRG